MLQAMSENVEIVRASIDAFNRGDIEAAFENVSSSTTRRGPWY